MPLQLPLAYRENDTVPARLPPAGADTVTESLGTQFCALVKDEATDVQRVTVRRFAAP